MISKPTLGPFPSRPSLACRPRPAWLVAGTSVFVVWVGFQAAVVGHKAIDADAHTGPVATQILRSIVAKADPDQLLRHLPAVDQEVYKSRTRPWSCSQPQFYWIFKNMDFDQWWSANDLKALWLSGPAECRISDAASHIVDLLKESYPELQHSVLYFFCFTAPFGVSIAITFVSTIVRLLIRCSPKLEQEITTVFLRTLLDSILRKDPQSKPEMPRFSAGDSAVVVVEKILKAQLESDAYWGALRAVTDIQREKGLSLIIDGLDRSEHQKCKFIQELCVFIEYLGGRPSTTQILLTSRPQAEIKEILCRLPSIEYDRERKGLSWLISYPQDKQGN